MRCVWKTEQMGLEFREIPEPKRTLPSQVKIRVRYCSIGDRDLRMYQKGDYCAKEGIAGYEFVGEIAELGEQAAEQGFAVGDRVTGMFALFCGKCKFCRRHQENRCVNILSNPGTLCEYVVRHYRQLVKLPPDMDDATGTLVCPVAEIMEAVEKLDVHLGDTVAVLGGGFSGVAGMLLCRKRGADSVVVVDDRPSRRQSALAMGADLTLDPKCEEFPLQMLRATDFMGYDVILETSLNPETLHRSMDHIARGGKLCTVVYYDMDRNITWNSSWFYHSSASYMSSFLFNNKMDDAVRFLRQTDLSPLLVAQQPFSRAVEAFALLKENRHGRVGIVMP